ncbi:MAG: exonuclease SbcCD subunit D [Clostridia bacterium]|nr:exonuclease SbcCD subunit D [Clostridia bacterium]
MKLTHLSDLHLGKRVHEVSMIEDQQYILQQILRIIDDEQPDAVLIAGDVYDRSVPSAEAVALLDEFLVQLAERAHPVMMIGGNHDNAERLSFGSRLLAHSNIHIFGAYDGKVVPLTLSDAYGEADIWPLPFIRPVQIRHCFPDAEAESYTDAVRVAVEAMPLVPGRRNVLVSHQFVTGAATCESEEFSVGGTVNVDAAVFDAFDYVALGHIHNRQNIGNSRIHYCGTPLKYSFSEATHEKSVTVITLGAKGDLHLQLRPLVPKHDLREIRGRFAELTDPAFYTHTNCDDYLHVVLTDEQDIPEVAGRLRDIYPNILHISYDNTRTRIGGMVADAADVAYKTDLELFEELFEQINGRAMSDEQRGCVENLIEAIQEELA